MQERQLFEYAVIRVVPQVEREEFLNVGVIMYCPKQKFLKAAITLDDKRLSAFCPKLDIETIVKYLHAFNEIAKGTSGGGPIAKLSLAERFRWLTATRSTVLQTSGIHPGLCLDAGQTLEKLHTEMVL